MFRISDIIVCRQQIDSNVCRQPDNAPGILSARLFPGRYALYFCPPGYSGAEFTGSCIGRETDWINVTKDQTTAITYQIPPDIEKPSLQESDLVAKFTDKNGNPVPDLHLKICNYDASVKVCSPDFRGYVTDTNGLLQAKLRSGKYLIRVAFAQGFDGKYNWYPLYEIDDLNVVEGNPTKISWQMPAPNLAVKFTDATGSLIPSHEFVLCRAIGEIGNCALSASLWGGWFSTNKQGIFEANIQPGVYFILTCKIGCSGPPFDYKISDINVASNTEVTTIVYQLYK